jgi:hypothetical protein
MARWVADCSVDRIRDRFGWDAVGYASVALGISRFLSDEFRKLAEKDLRPSLVTGENTSAFSALSLCGGAQVANWKIDAPGGMPRCSVPGI